MACYQKLVLGTAAGKPDLVLLPDGLVACTKACYNSIIKAGKNIDGRGDWKSDGKNGPDDPNTSMKALLDWWATEGNYARYAGKDNKGVKKIKICEYLATLMPTKREPKSIMSKINHMKSAFIKAHVWAESETGAGLLASQGEMSFRASVHRYL